MTDEPDNPPVGDDLLALLIDVLERADKEEAALKVIRGRRPHELRDVSKKLREYVEALETDRARLEQEIQSLRDENTELQVQADAPWYAAEADAYEAVGGEGASDLVNWDLLHSERSRMHELEAYERALLDLKRAWVKKSEEELLAVVRTLRRLLEF